jgi:hypothetical protein
MNGRVGLRVGGRVSGVLIVSSRPSFAKRRRGASVSSRNYNEGFITAAAARPKAKDAAERAVLLDGQSAEAHASTIGLDVNASFVRRSL